MFAQVRFRRGACPRQACVPILGASSGHERSHDILRHDQDRILRVHAVTSTIAKPSYPLLPTVWIAAALTRGLTASASKNRRIPTRLGSSFPASITFPSRTTLSTTIKLPGRDNFRAQEK